MALRPAAVRIGRAAIRAVHVQVGRSQETLRPIQFQSISDPFVVKPAKSGSTDKKLSHLTNCSYLIKIRELPFMDVNGFIAKSNHEKNVNLSADVTNLVTEMANVIAAGSGSVGYAIVLVVVAHVVLVIGRIWHVRFALAVARATETTGASSTDYAADLAAAVEVVLMVLRLSDFS